MGVLLFCHFIIDVAGLRDHVVFTARKYAGRVIKFALFNARNINYEVTVCRALFCDDYEKVILGSRGY